MPASPSSPGSVKSLVMSVTALRGAWEDVYTSAMRKASPSFGALRTLRIERRGLLPVVFALSWAVVASGCGQKGPLYHPPEPEVETAPVREKGIADDALPLEDPAPAEGTEPTGETEKQRTDDTTGTLLPALDSRHA